MNASVERRLLVLTSLLFALGAAILFVLSARGTFAAAVSAPRISALSIALVATASLLVRRRTALGTRVIITSLAIALSGLAVGAHNRRLTQQREDLERPAKAALLGRKAPSLRWVHAFNLPAGVEKPLVHSGGKTTVVDFWATWCGPCRLHMPQLEDLHQQWGTRGLRVIGVTTFYSEGASAEGRRAELQAIEAFLRQHRITYPILVAEAEDNHRAYHVSDLPASVLIGPNGAVLDFGIGTEGTAAVFEHAKRNFQRQSRRRGGMAWRDEEPRHNNQMQEATWQCRHDKRGEIPSG